MVTNEWWRFRHNFELASSEFSQWFRCTAKDNQLEPTTLNPKTQQCKWPWSSHITYMNWQWSIFWSTNTVVNGTMTYTILIIMLQPAVHHHLFYVCCTVCLTTWFLFWFVLFAFFCPKQSFNCIHLSTLDQKKLKLFNCVLYLFVLLKYLCILLCFYFIHNNLKSRGL